MKPNNLRHTVHARNNEDVSPAFEILLESVETEVTKLNELGSEAFRKREYEMAKELAAQAQQFTNFRAKVLTLSSEWEKLKRATTPVEADSTEKTSRQNLGKLRKGMRTPELAFYGPIIEALVESSGRAEMNKVLDRLHAKMGKLFKPVDLEPLASGPKTNVRWRNTAQWARNTLKEQGYLKSDSPHGIWEVTDAGRKWLEKAVASGNQQQL